MPGVLTLERITALNFAEWKKMRQALYGVDEAFDNHEMKNIVDNPQWHCMFITEGEVIIGFVELSLRNIVDGCLSSPVPYIEGVYLKEAHRAQGKGRQVIELIKKWSTALGFSEMAADVEFHNTISQKFFTAMGFGETYRTIGFRIDLSE